MGQLKKYMFLGETSTKMMLNYIIEVEFCAKAIIDNYFKQVLNECFEILNITLNSNLCTDESFSFSVSIATSDFSKTTNIVVDIPTKAFDNCDEKCLDIKIIKD